MIEEAWGPWQIHDGKSAPVGHFAQAITFGGFERLGRVTNEAVCPPVGTASRWIYDASDMQKVALFRIRKPRGLTMLEDIARGVKEPEGVE